MGDRGALGALADSEDKADPKGSCLTLYLSRELSGTSRAVALLCSAPSRDLLSSSATLRAVIQ